MKQVSFITGTDYVMFGESPISSIVDIVGHSVNSASIRGNNKGIYYYNVPSSFDIETTSFYVDETGNAIDYAAKSERRKTDPDYNPEKRAIMYVWQFGINGRLIMGRTWAQFVKLCDILSSQLDLNNKRRLVVYVHNLAFEFQFLRKWFKWQKVFAVDTRTPVYAVTNNGIEFRCSLLLSGFSLAKLGEQLIKYPVKKLVGDLDYSLMRHSKTPLTDKEIGYCLNDVKVVMAYIQESIEREGDITKLPITNTGYVRNLCRERCFKYGKRRNLNYMDLMRDLVINNLEEFDALQRAFQGGFTHASPYYSGMVIHNVASYDFTSSYPAVMLSEQFPMSRGKKVTLTTWAEFEENINNYCCVFDAQFTDIEPCTSIDNPISASKCFILDNPIVNNGRVVSASRLATTITNVDYKVYEAFYRWAKVDIANMYIYKRGYLPKEIILSILDLYGKKTMLKGVTGKEVEYLQSKGMINSVYGMCVTNPLREENIYTDSDSWETPLQNENQRAQMLFEHNTNPRRFLFYPWGVFVTAYARRNLFSGILAFGTDYVYSDTDSIKAINADQHKDYIEWYNNRIQSALLDMVNHYDIDPELLKPKTIKGIEKPIGVWDYEGTYKSFKTLGAKRYMIEQESATTIDGVEYPINITVAGVNKRAAVPYIFNNLAHRDTEKAFRVFADFLYIPPEYSGKLIHTYIDQPSAGKMIDYLGNEADYIELSSVHLESSDYNLSISSIYLRYLLGVQKGRYDV